MACLEAKHVPIKNIWYIMERKDKGGPKPKMQNPPLGFFFFFLGFHLLQQLLSLVPKHVQGVVKRYDALSEPLVSYSKYFPVFIVTMFDVLHLTALHHLNDLQILSTF